MENSKGMGDIVIFLNVRNLGSEKVEKHFIVGQTQVIRIRHVPT